MIVPMSVNNEISMGALFQIEDSGASASHGYRICDKWRVGAVHRPKKADILRQFPSIISSEDKPQVFSFESNSKHNC